MSGTILTLLVLSPFVLIGALAVGAVLRPVQDPAAPSDAIVVFAGGEGERLARAVALAEAGVAPRLLANLGVGPWVGREAIGALCARDDLPYEARCLLVESDDTAGEARAFAEIARREGLGSLLLVTSDYHLARARLRLRRCFDGSIRAVGAGGRHTARTTLHEIGGLAEALLLDRRCR